MKLFPAGSMPLNYVKSPKGPFEQGDYVAIGGVSPGEFQGIFSGGLSGGWHGQQSGA